MNWNRVTLPIMKMFELISVAIVYILFLYYLIKDLLRNDTRRPLQEFFNYYKQQYNEFIENQSEILQYFGYPFGSKREKIIQFDKTGDFKKVMFDITNDFNNSYDVIRHYLLKREVKELKDVVEWVDKVIQYNVPHGKRTRGLILAASFKYFAPNYKLTKKNMEVSFILGWCMEFLQGSALVIDDIMDQSIMRRGQKCWYLNEDVGNIAINDAIILQHLIYELMRHYISNNQSYNEIAELTRIISYKTSLGQCIDLLTTPEGASTDFSLLIESRYATIVKYKTSFYSFDLPVRLAMLFSGIRDEKIHEEAQRILIRMGHLFQVQDDFIDCFGDPEIIGKIGTDIEDGKCSWVAVEAVKRMSKNQIIEFKENYGLKVEDSVKIIKKIYNDLNMIKVFKEFEDFEYKEIIKDISRFGKRWRVEVIPFYGLLNIIYKRKK